MRIHREGLLIIPISLILIGMLVVLGFFVSDGLGYLLLVAGIILSGFIVQFFRNPVIDIPANPQAILSPCDGKVVVIEEVEDQIYFQDKRMQISIFMSPLDVHVNRNPVSGHIVFYQYYPGKYLMAFNPKSSSLNEQNYIVARHDLGELAFKQIAGFMARRIKCYVSEGDVLKQGEEFGFIRFGSRVDLLLPLDAEISVRLGDKVRAGQSIIGSWSTSK